MSEQEPEPGEDGFARLESATAQLAARRDGRWVEVAGRVLDGALSASRRSALVRAQDAAGAGAPGAIRVSASVVKAYLLEALDGAVPGTAVRDLRISVTGADTFAGVLVDVVVQLGTPLLPAADRLHEDAAEVLADLLGPGVVRVTIRPTHVHVGDVVEGDPQFLDPTRAEPPEGP